MLLLKSSFKGELKILQKHANTTKCTGFWPLRFKNSEKNEKKKLLILFSARRFATDYITDTDKEISDFYRGFR